MAALGLVNNRDISAMQDATQNAGISAGAAASANSLQAQTDLARRGQDLDAIKSLMQGNQFNISTLGSLGSQLSDEQFKSLGSIPDLEGVHIAGLNAAGGAGSALAGLEGSLASTHAQAGAARAALNFQQTQYYNALPQQQIDSYLRTIGLIGGMGGTETGVNPGSSVPMVNSTAAALLGGAGGALTAYGVQRGG
jgi:hypothetical protein